MPKPHNSRQAGMPPAWLEKFVTWLHCNPFVCEMLVLVAVAGLPPLEAWR